ncbi:MAG: hypothetical protein D6794_00695 [Deltaproteobacteria bacterium]|nr:MAG: hypothetical protein D6794_00695 [Deltaproteobacteria bacterium]
MERVRVALIGAGRTGTTFLREMLKYDYVEVLGVSDLEESAPGMQLARERGIETTPDPMELLGLGEKIDILVDLSGDLEFKRRIKDYFERIDNTHTIIMHELIARLCISLATRQNHLLPTVHPEDTGIGY